MGAGRPCGQVRRAGEGPLELDGHPCSGQLRGKGQWRSGPLGKSQWSWETGLWERLSRLKGQSLGKAASLGKAGWDERWPRRRRMSWSPDSWPAPIPWAWLWGR